MKRAFRWIGVLSGVLVIAIVLGAAAGFAWLRGSLPDLDGERLVAGLEAPAEVLRDADGIVTIRAASEADAARALGYAHAQDRLFQMDMTRRTAAGRLSEVLGVRTLAFDKLMRGLGLYRLAEANLALLSDPARSNLEAYAEGVNAFLTQSDLRLPPEFLALRYEPEPWRPADSLAWGRLMALQLSGNWRHELRRLELAERLTPEQIAFLWPAYPEDGPVTVASRATDSKRAAATPAVDPPVRLARPAGSGGPIDPASVIPWTWAPKSASNVWILAGDKTASGKPILANDPHLGLNAPGQWYLTRIETPETTLAGVTAPGIPFLALGHNGHVAWGFTTTHADTQDLFLERESRGKPGHYDTPEGPRPFETREEIIKVRDAEPQVLTLRSTRHGPVFSDLRAELAEALPEGHVLALSWTALRADDRTGEALYRLNHARNWPDFEAALAQWHSPVQNVAYADTTGEIGFVVAGRIPQRASGDGRAVVPGWSGVYDWLGEIPFAGLPRERNPGSGRLVNANNRVAGPGYTHLIAADWPDPHRAVRIEAALDGDAEITVTASEMLQQDVLSEGTARLLPLMLEKLRMDDADVGVFHARLSDWDHRMARDRPEPLMFATWVAATAKRILEDELGEDLSRHWLSDYDLLADILVQDNSWCDDVRTADSETCGVQVTRARDGALAELRERFGGDPGDWRWGQAHVARFHHPLLRHVPLAERLFGFPVETDGGSYTVNRGGARFDTVPERRFEHVHGPGFRAVYDLSDLNNSRFMIATGQSGNPLSPLYGSLAERWRDGAYVKLVGPEKAATDRLVLNPG